MSLLQSGKTTSCSVGFESEMSGCKDCVSLFTYRDTPKCQAARIVFRHLLTEIHRNVRLQGSCFVIYLQRYTEMSGCKDRVSLFTYRDTPKWSEKKKHFILRRRKNQNESLIKAAGRYCA